MHIFKLPLLLSMACQSVCVQRARLCFIGLEVVWRLALTRKLCTLPKIVVSSEINGSSAMCVALSRAALIVLGKCDYILYTIYH